MPSFPPSKHFVKAMLAGHSVMGLTAAVLLYLVCVSGTFSVFYPDFERWEQAQAPEMHLFDPALVNNAAKEILARETTLPDHVFVGFPTDDVPRVTVTAGESSAFVAADGSLGEAVNHEWTHFLVAMHYALTLPTGLGLAIVGIIGIMLTAMIVSGILAHPNIFKDAFLLRANRSQRLQQVDLHNRLSVWTAPFQLMIALTGAFVGLSQVFIFMLATLFYQGDAERATESLFNSDPAPTGIEAPLANIETALEAFREDFPGVKPMSLTIHEPATTAQIVEVGALLPDRLVWGEFYLYDSDGNYLERAGWSDGEAGAQLYASVFRPHFGHFAGLPMKIAYLGLGLVMCFVVVSGVNIWLLRRSREGRPAKRTERLWIASVWGVPLAIAFSALAYLGLRIDPTLVFWLSMAALLVIAGLVEDKAKLSKGLRTSVAAVSALVVLLHVVRFGSDAFNPASLLINMLWLGLATTMLLSLGESWRRGSRQQQTGVAAQAIKD